MSCVCVCVLCDALKEISSNEFSPFHQNNNFCVSSKYRNSLVHHHHEQEEAADESTMETSKSMASTVQLVHNSTDVIDSSNISASTSTISTSPSASDQLQIIAAPLDLARKSKRNRFKAKFEQPKYEFYFILIFVCYRFSFHHSYYSYFVNFSNSSSPHIYNNFHIQTLLD